MNYIKQMQADLKERDDKLERLKGNVAEFMTYLHSPKFTGLESDGGRRDWIATGDVLHWLMEVRGEL